MPLPLAAPPAPPTKLYYAFIYFEIYSPCVSLFFPPKSFSRFIPLPSLISPNPAFVSPSFFQSLSGFSPPLSSLFLASTLSCFQRPEASPFRCIFSLSVLSLPSDSLLPFAPALPSFPPFPSLHTFVCAVHLKCHLLNCPQVVLAWDTVALIFAYIQ